MGVKTGFCGTFSSTATFCRKWRLSVHPILFLLAVILSPSFRPLLLSLSAPLLRHACRWFEADGAHDDSALKGQLVLKECISISDKDTRYGEKYLAVKVKDVERELEIRCEDNDKTCSISKFKEFGRILKETIESANETAKAAVAPSTQPQTVPSEVIPKEDPENLKDFQFSGEAEEIAGKVQNLAKYSSASKYVLYYVR